MDFLIRNMFENADIPGGQTVYDYYMDPKKDMSFRPWAELVPAFVCDPALPFFQLIVPTVETVRQAYCLEQLLSKQKSVFFTGITGIGKSIIVQHALNSLQTTRGVDPVQITFSAQTSSLRTQYSIEEKLQKKRRDLCGAQVGRQIAIFVDDVNMPAVELYGAQPPVELLRLLLDKHGLYDREKLFWKWIEDTTLICAAGPPGGGRRELSQRFTRRFNMVCISAPSKTVMQQIYQSILSEHLRLGKFTESVQGLAQDVVISTIEVYDCICEQLKPTPAKFHYTFNLRDVSKVFQGIMMTKSQSVGSADSLAKLWVHEICRVFYDRLVSSEDKAWLGRLVVQFSGKYIKSSWEYEDVFEKGKIYWGDTLKLDAPVRLYEEIKDTAKLRKVLENQLEDYNLKATRKMQLVFFEDAVEHVLRISRALRQPKGYIMLIGVGGSGKSVLTRLAAFMQRYEVTELEVRKDSGDAFKEYMKEVLQSAGVAGNQLCLLLTDAQVSNEGLLEDVNSLLNNGEIPNLFLTEELDKIVNELRPKVAELGRDESRTSIYSFFVERVRNNLHISLCMSPVGETLRLRCRKFPSLVNCCTLNWFSRWPDTALLSVSTKFLSDIEGASPTIKKALAEMCMQIHTSVEEKTGEFFSELRRRVYVTPKSYLDLIRVYVEGLKNKKKQMGDRKERLVGGIEKLKETGKQIAGMKKRLEELQPKLKEKSESLEISQQKVSEEQRLATEKERLVTIQSLEVNDKAKKAKSIADEAEAELNVLKPEIDAAMNEVKQLDRKSIIEIKTFNNPNPLVVMVMEAVMMLLNEKTDWNSIRFTLSDSGEFVSRLINFADKVAQVPELVIRKLRANYLSNPEFEPEKVASKSLAAKSISKWVRAMNNFYDVLKKAEPKRKRYEEEKANLDLANAALSAKTRELEEIKEKVGKLKADCEVVQNERNKLSEEMSVTRRRLTRAEELMGLLIDEDERWNGAVERMEEDAGKLVGNVFLSAACISYLGPFTGPYREAMISQWVKDIMDRKVPASPGFRLVTTMGDPIRIREWQNAGLPSDSISAENAIIATEAMRYPLMVDPQMQANRWIKQILKKPGVIVLRPTNSELIRTLSGAIRIGKSVLLEDVEETIDASLNALLEKQVFQNESGLRFIRLDNKDVEYDPTFKLYMTTKLPNPHYMPEVCIKVTVINFTVTFEGLQDQLLGDVVKQEQPEVEEKRNEVIRQLAGDKKALKDAEDNILRLLANSTLEQILDEEAVVDTLKNAKFTSSEISKRMEESARIEAQINKARDGYMSVAARGSTLYFVIADLINIDSMYQYSLDYIKQLFNQAIEKSPKSRTQGERLEALISNITKALFSNVSRGLFEAHKTIFSFLICTSIRRKESATEITEQEWNFLIRPVGVFKGDAPAKPLQSKISDAGWTLALTLERDVSERFGGIVKDFVENSGAWERYAGDLKKLPGEWEARLTPFAELLMIKVFRPEMLLSAAVGYVRKELGEFYVENAAGNVEDVYQDSKNFTPIIFVLSQGADPTLMLLKFAEDHKYREKMAMLSLGQGQGPTAKRMIQAAQAKGDWVLLQNCHLAKSWMKELETLVESFKTSKDLHDNFRLFLTSMPADYFPASVLQNGVKLTTEPPRGIKANLRRSYQEISQARFTSCGQKLPAWRQLLFGLCFFHSVMQERRKFGPLGFNIRYEFNDSDLETSITMLKMFLEEQEVIPWDALNFVVGHINYGGRVTDDWDRRCLLCILKIFCTPQILEKDYKFSASGAYFAPRFETLDEFRKFIEGLPQNDAPEVFGMHENADITYHGNESATLLRTILKVQPRTASRY